MSSTCFVRRLDCRPTGPTASDIGCRHREKVVRPSHRSIPDAHTTLLYLAKNPMYHRKRINIIYGTILHMCLQCFSLSPFTSCDPWQLVEIDRSTPSGALLARHRSEPLMKDIIQQYTRVPRAAQQLSRKESAQRVGRFGRERCFSWVHRRTRADRSIHVYTGARVDPIVGPVGGLGAGNRHLRFSQVCPVCPGELDVLWP